MNAVTVTELSNYIKSLLDNNENLNAVLVRGELSNYKIHSSGHHYFSLKDDGAVISAVMFKGNASKIRFLPQNGMKVVLFGKVSSFPKSGQYQIYVSDMQPEGIGALYAAYEQLKQKLYAEGLFDKSHKKPLPRFPSTVALVTSSTGAAVRDMIRILNSRFPMSRVLVCPVKVQGVGAAEDIAAMLDYVNEHRLADVIICGRGGGSIEDLWAFNEEVLARAIYRSEIPVISAVGHEPDITIADYVADVRAATPSNGAEIAVYDSTELRALISGAWSRMLHAEKNTIDRRRQKLMQLSAKKAMSSPQQYLSDRRMYLAMLEQRMEKTLQSIISRKKQAFVKAAATLDAISPLKVIGRGYSMVTENGRVLRSVDSVQVGDDVDITMADGTLRCRVNEKRRENNGK